MSDDLIDRPVLIAALERELDGSDGGYVDGIATAMRLVEDAGHRAPLTRRWIGEAHAAFDQALALLPEDRAFDADFFLQRAGVAAQIASAEQARVANLIAWKQLQATRASSADQGAGLLPLGGADEITDDIETSLGITGDALPIDEGGLL